MCSFTVYANILSVTRLCDNCVHVCYFNDTHTHTELTLVFDIMLLLFTVGRD